VNYLLRQIRNFFISNKRRDLFRALRPGALVLDVGCGNDSAFHAKNINPHMVYEGVDIGEYHLDHKDAFDGYTLVDSEQFAMALECMSKEYDLVISNHNIEHCFSPYRVLEAMCVRLKPGGMLYLAFPHENTIGLPSRSGSLNFYDDATHSWLPSASFIIQLLENNGLTLLEAHVPYQPGKEYLLGLFMEPLSRLKNKVMPGTWAYWGFENVLIAMRPVD